MTSLQRTITPLTQENWSDFEAVMGDRGGSLGCWRMHWRLSIAESSSIRTVEAYPVEPPHCRTADP